MDYTTSDGFASHAATGHRMHQRETGLTTEVTGDDMNASRWELLKLIEDAGITPLPFDPDVPATYSQVKAAVVAMIAASNPQLNLGDATLAGANYTTTLSPSAIPAVFTVRFLAAQPANPTLTVGGTTAPMVDSDGDPITGIAANERRTVQWANGQFTVSESDAKLSNAELLALASSQTGTHPSAGKPTAAPTAANPATELTNTNGEVFRWSGSSWYFVAKVTDVPTGASFGPSGWQKLPSGLIIQWGVVPCVQNARQNISFNVAFPNQVFSVVCNGVVAADIDVHPSYPVDQSIISYSLWTTSAFKVQLNTPSPGNGKFLYWQAIGN